MTLLRTCLVLACANTLFNTRDSSSPNFHKAAVVARRTTRLHASYHPHQLPRHSFATFPRPGSRRRTQRSASPLRSFYYRSKLAQSLTRRAVGSRRPSQATEDMDEMVLLQRSMDENLRNGALTPEDRRHSSRAGSRDDTKPRRFPDESITSPSSQTEDFASETRSARSASTTSRSTNRLSLTLPIVPPTAYPLRSTPASTTTPAFPPTPLDTPALMSPVDPNDLITAIAAQERRVLELREELNRAESDLSKLKKQWATHEAYKKRTGRRNVEPAAGLGPAAELQDETAIRRSAEIDRRKALLGQNNPLATPERSRRRVFTGRHTRTLSLLSPTRPVSSFSATTDDEPESAGPSEPGDRFNSPESLALQAKRASWAARTTQTAGVKQLAEDLKTGLWTFMEDLRQATVGDEPITGQGNYMRGTDGNMKSATGSSGDQDTIRAPNAPRPRLSSAFDDPAKASEDADNNDGNDDPQGLPRPRLLRRSQTDAGARGGAKRFSWTPLTIDAYDDNDWSNWDTPGVSSPRWSGTTVNGDIIPTIPEKRADEGENTSLSGSSINSSHNTSRSTSPHQTASASPASLSPKRLEDLLPQALNKLKPSNLKRTADDFMKEWERSLASPEEVEPTIEMA
ncbi:uncharacterized protein C8A04DRAFT_38411 [Dichotomopilus funicola]|uniref:DUF4048 domain-containing protein n=1 Tax=Dichotomopilus funicola TaxID=1934379 RepID=A0AAN6V1E9_9PEZI|nr:hypothetical protein C8A04DRAFT_38411 [Dichotomopilus funicola]